MKCHKKDLIKHNKELKSTNLVLKKKNEILEKLVFKLKSENLEQSEPYKQGRRNTNPLHVQVEETGIEPEMDTTMIKDKSKNYPVGSSSNHLFQFIDNLPFFS